MPAARRSITLWIYPYPLYEERVGILQQRFPERAWKAEPLPDFWRRSEQLGRMLRAPWTSLCLFPASFQEIPSLARRGWLKPLDHLLGRHRNKTFTRAALEPLTVDGQLYALPEDVTPYALLARRDLLRQHGFSPATDWEAFEKQLRILRRQGGSPPAAAQGSGPNPICGFLFALLGSNGIQPAESPRHLVTERARLEEAYRYFGRLIREGLLGPAPRPHRRGRIGFNDVKEGRQPYYFAWPGSVAKWPVDVLKDMDVLPFPIGPSARQRCLPVHGHGWCIPHNAVALDLAFEALTAMTTPDFQRECELAGGCVFPARPALWRDAEVLARKPVYSCANALFKKQVYFPVRHWSQPWMEFEHDLLEAVQDDRPFEAWWNKLLEHQGETTHAATHPRLRRALLLIDQHMDRIGNVKDLASELNISPTHLRRLFHKEINQGVADYLRHRRLERATELMSDLTLSLKEIAFKTGFSSTSYFTQAFRAHFGCSPTQMRKEGSARPE